MKRVAVIALLALSLPMAAWATSSIDIINRGGSISASMSGLSGTSTVIAIGDTGGPNLATLTFQTGAFATASDAQNGGMLAAGGSFVITGSSGIIFSGTFTGPVQWGLLTAADGSHNYTLTGAISGTWTATGATVVGATTQITLNTGKGFFSGTVDISSGDTNIVIPEPGTLGLLGTGLLGIAGLVRRKLTT